MHDDTSLFQYNPREGYRPIRAFAVDAWRATGMPAARRQLRYLDEVLSLRCTFDLLVAGLFPSTAAAKELTETCAAFHAARNPVIHFAFVPLLNDRPNFRPTYNTLQSLCC
jgi:hypothetical protein